MITWRTLTECDVAEIRAWPKYAADMVQMDYALRENGWLDECRGQDSLFYAFERDDELVAFTILQKTGEGAAEFRIALRADRTGLGLGEGITRQTLQLGFEDHRLSRIYLIVRKNNRRGHRLYRRIGFADRGECIKTIQGVEVDFCLMEMRSDDFESSCSGCARRV